MAESKDTGSGQQWTRGPLGERTLAETAACRHCGGTGMASCGCCTCGVCSR